jgi:alkylation response protein AidB-like acyl-CoA dehydrogenase
MEHLGRMGWSEEQSDLLEVAEKFCCDKSPIEKVRSLLEDELGYDQGVWREIADLGWLGIAIPEEYGGVGLNLAEVAPVMEQMGRNLMATPFASTTLAAQALLAGGTEAQKQKLLPALAGGAVATVALVEDNNDWNLENVSARAAKSNDVLHLSGVKRFVCDAAAADWVIASVLHDGAPMLAAIEKAALPDGAMRRENIVDETRRSFELTLDSVEIPLSALFDSEKIRPALAHIHLAANLLGAAEMVGGTGAVIDYTIEYLNTRKQFGKLIGSYQALKHPTVDAFVHYEQARSHLYGAANCFNEQGTGEIATRMAKAQADKAFSYAADRAIQFHGGFGFTYDCDAQLYRRRAIWHASQYGDAAYHKKKLASLLLVDAL